MMIDKKDIIFEFDISYNISHNKDYFCCSGKAVNLYGIRNGELKTTFKDIKHPGYSAFTSDNRLIVKSTTGEYGIYDIENNKLLKVIQPPKGIHGSITNFAVTPDDKYIIDFAAIFPFIKLMFVEIETGEYMLYDLSGARGCRILNNKSESKYYVATAKCRECGNPKTYYMDLYSFEYPFQELVLNEISFNDMDFSEIDYRNGKLALVAYSNIINIYDMNSDSKEQLKYERDGVLYSLRWSESGKYLALAESRAIHIIDVATGKLIHSFDVDYGCFASFYDNDTKLLIGTWNNGYCMDLSSIL